MAMTAHQLGLAHPTPRRPALRLVRATPQVQRRPSAAVYRRRRVVAGLALIAVVLAVPAVALPRAGHATAVPEPATVVVVGPDDTAWDLARVHAPAGMSVADYALAIVRDNGVDATALQPGTVLRLPR